MIPAFIAQVTGFSFPLNPHPTLHNHGFCDVEVFVPSGWESSRPSALVVMTQRTDEKATLADYSWWIAVLAYDRFIVPRFPSIAFSDILFVESYPASRISPYNRMEQVHYQEGEVATWHRIHPEEIERVMKATYQQMGLSEPARWVG